MLFFSVYLFTNTETDEVDIDVSAERDSTTKVPTSNGEVSQERTSKMDI